MAENLRSGYASGTYRGRPVTDPTKKKKSPLRSAAGKAFKRVAPAGVAADAVSNAATTTTQDYVDRFNGLGPSYPERNNEGLRLTPISDQFGPLEAGDPSSFMGRLKNAAIRTGGAVTDVADTLTGGTLGNAYFDDVQRAQRQGLRDKPVLNRLTEYVQGIGGAQAKPQGQAPAAEPPPQVKQGEATVTLPPQQASREEVSLRTPPAQPAPTGASLRDRTDQRLRQLSADQLRRRGEEIIDSTLRFEGPDAFGTYNGSGRRLDWSDADQQAFEARLDAGRRLVDLSAAGAEAEAAAGPLDATAAGLRGSSSSGSGADLGDLISLARLRRDIDNDQYERTMTEDERAYDIVRGMNTDQEGNTNEWGVLADRALTDMNRGKGEQSPAVQSLREKLKPILVQGANAERGPLDWAQSQFGFDPGPVGAKETTNPMFQGWQIEDSTVGTRLKAPDGENYVYLSDVAEQLDMREDDRRLMPLLQRLLSEDNPKEKTDNRSPLR